MFVRFARYGAAIVFAAAMFVRSASALELDSIAKTAAAYTNADPRLQAMFRAALLNTSRQATIADDGTAYVKTGDVPAEWLRDAGRRSA